MAVLEARNLYKSYGTVKALDDVSIEIEDAELLAVIGPSGSGKTTLLRSIAGFVQLDSGKIFIKSKDITELPPEKRNVAMFFQNYALWPHMTVFENVAYGLKIKKCDRKEIKERVDWALEFLDIKSLAERKPNQLSGGQQQRVALARAIVVQPDVLLLDEPLSNLDAKIRMRIRFELKALQKKLKIPTLYVTHDQEEALSIADRIAIMHNGKVLQVGTPQEVYRSPANLFVADFIGVNSVVTVPRTGEGPLRVGNLRIDTSQQAVRVVIRAEEAKVLPIEREMLVQEGDLKLEGTIVGKLYMGFKYRYEIMVKDIQEPLFINSEESFEPKQSVQILVRKGSFFVYE
ncbi:ABC transporter ATP-binding protein [Pseudothermotoga sp. U03pept]|uniref:ABC transporter ATP-binding protein n=1 Tax=Pseudothermotoga sp. U03pept TaxID=3447012 RepID=UPI003EFE05BC